MILGSVDFIDGECAAGWVYSALFPDPFKVQAFINHDLIGETVADIFRPDLADAGLGSGRCGFEIRFFNLIEPDYLPFVEVRPTGSTLCLPRTNFAGLGDYFAALYSKFPTVGRHASVLGGLWTDRTDASPVLKARVDIDLISQIDSGPISRFIQEGLVILDCQAEGGTSPIPLPAPSNASDSSDLRELISPATDRSTPQRDLATALGDVFFHDVVLRFLRSILDDHPIAVSAETWDSTQKEFSQFSVMDDLPSPTECLGLVAPYRADPIILEVLRASHRLPEFRPDGHSRWTSRSALREAVHVVSGSTPIDLYTISPGQVALVGPGLMHRLAASPGASAFWILALSARLGYMRFRQRRPAEELFHHSGARIWMSG